MLVNNTITTICHIPFSVFSKNIGLWYSHVVEVDHASARCPDAELVLWLGHGETGCLPLYDEASDAFVTLNILNQLFKKWQTYLFSIVVTKIWIRTNYRYTYFLSITTV